MYCKINLKKQWIEDKQLKLTKQNSKEKLIRLCELFIFLKCINIAVYTIYLLYFYITQTQDASKDIST